MITGMGPEQSKKMFLYIDAGIFPEIPDGLKDDTHLNEVGATKVAALAVEGLKELNLPLTRYLKK
jgi:lysophospholipase L1-like esterase